MGRNDETLFPRCIKTRLISQGNHEDEESESEKTQNDIEAWIPSLKETPEARYRCKSWDKYFMVKFETSERCLLICYEQPGHGH